MGVWGFPGLLDGKDQIRNDNSTLSVLHGKHSDFQHNEEKGETPSTRPSSVTP